MPSYKNDKKLTNIYFSVGAQPSPRYNCPHCKSQKVILYGKKCGKQRFRCKDCGRTFVTTTNTIMYMSHQPKPVWKEMVSAALQGDSLRKSETERCISHDCAFHMRHKILMAMQDFQSCTFSDVSELGKTYVLDSYKGAKLPDELGRSTRKHGGTASKRGLSQEYYCICTGVQRTGDAMAITVNRAKPSAEELKTAFVSHLNPGVLALCDGHRDYEKVAKAASCAIKDVTTATAAETGFYNLNCVNNFHSFIKERYKSYRGVASKYLNRYNTLFAAAYKCGTERFNSICHNLFNVSAQTLAHTLADVKAHELLSL